MSHNLEPKSNQTPPNIQKRPQMFDVLYRSRCSRLSPNRAVMWIISQFQISLTVFPILFLPVPIPVHPDSDAPRPPRASRSPAPAGAVPDGKMIPAKGGPRAHETHQGAEDDVEPVVAKVGVARRGNVDGDADRKEGRNEQVYWWSGGLVPEQRLQWGVWSM